MNATTKKAFRDLWRSKAQVIAVAVTIMLGVMIYIATAGAFQNLSASYDQTYERLHFADLTATGGDLDAVAQDALDAGASAAITRTQVDPPMLIEDTKLVGRVIGMPTDAQPAVNQVDVIDGDYFDEGATDQILLETHAADTFGVGPGDTLQIFSTTGWVDVTVQGVVDSPEYLWPARSRQEILSDPNSFAVAFAPEESVQGWFEIPANQTQVLLPDTADARVASEKREPWETDTGIAVAQAMTDAGASALQSQADQPSNATLSEDLQGFDQMSVAFPALFLIAAGVASWVLLTRRILQETPVIGTMMAAGARRGRVLRHYVLQGLLMGGVGALLGVALGVPANAAITSAYTGFIGVPDTVVRNYPWMLVIGLVFGVVVGVLGALGPAVSASRIAPAQAMRPASDAKAPGGWSRWVARQRWLPVSGRMALRDVVRSKRRTLATMLGTVLALVLVLTSVGMMTSILAAITTQFEDIELEDASVVAQSEAGVGDALADVDGVERVEATTLGQVTLKGPDGTYQTTLTGFEPDTQMHGFIGTDGTAVTLPDDGVLAGQFLSEEIGIAAGDTITITSDAGQNEVTVVGFLDEPIGTSVYATNDTARSLLPNEGTESYALAFTAESTTETARDQIRDTVTQLEGVVAYQDVRAIVGQLNQYLGLFWAFIGIMIVMGTVLALAVMYVTMSVNVVERTGELATLRAAGAPLRKVAGAVATENLVATVLGIPFGLAIGAWSAGAFLASFNDDLFTLELQWGWWTLPAAALGVLLAAAVSQWPAARAIRRVDIARVVRERAA
ncbi:ABC transporter permease [Demequina globuliformis]|uniref:ABC transporter permease n=1 Tax=Demequina globuliformis TaxID=676202 RepID=UPI0007847C21|nr:ABC transporter permease [Demequina globuliformis]